MIYCNQCGGQLKDSANFCKYCGAKIKKQDIEATNIQSLPEKPKYEKIPSLYEKSVLPTEDLTQQPPNQEGSVDPFLMSEEQTFDPMPEDTIDKLYSRERDVDIKEELKEILTEVEKIEQRLSIGLISQNEASRLISDKQDLIGALKAERKSLKLEKVPVEQLAVETKDAKEKLDKLFVLYNEGKISHESVYTKLKSEYSETYQSKLQTFEREKANVVQWLRVLEIDIHKLKEDIDVTKVKAGLGEISDVEANNKQQLLEIEIYRKELAYHALKAINQTIIAN